MTGLDMITSLGYRMEDTGHDNFIAAQKLIALNDAQRQVVSMCSNEALVHLQAQEDLDTVQTDSNLGGLKYFALPSPVDGNPNPAESLMTRMVKAYDNTNDRFIELVSPDGFSGNTSYNYGTVGTLMGNRLYVSTADTAIVSCILIYISTPANIVANGTEIENLSDSIQQAIVETAESLLWRQDNRQERAGVAKQNALEMVAVINGIEI
jgi:hypothetical protein